MIIELHMLQNFSPACLNRDDTNSPKECEFGGYRRARISSQCIKRSIREYFKSGSLLSSEDLAVRTLRLVDELVNRLTQKGKPEDEARQITREAVKGINLKLAKEDYTQYLIFIGKKEIDQIENLILEQWDELAMLSGKEAKGGEKKKGALQKSFLDVLNGGQAVDLALFGRMLADLPNKNIDAASQVAHAISTHKVGVEFDFYTAMDDLSTSEDNAGAGMMGVIEFNSACFYRYANIDFTQLEKNLGGNNDLAQKAVEAFIRASATAIPSGKQNSFAAHNPPSFVFVIARNSGMWSLANAFAEPIRTGSKGSLIENSITALLDYWDKLIKVYGDGEVKERAAFSLEKRDLGELNSSNLDGLVDRVNRAIEARC